MYCFNEARLDWKTLSISPTSRAFLSRPGSALTRMILRAWRQTGRSTLFVGGVIEVTRAELSYDAFALRSTPERLVPFSVAEHVVEYAEVLRRLVGEQPMGGGSQNKFPPGSLFGLR